MKKFYSIFMALTLVLMGAPSDDFVITVKTDNNGASSSTQFTIPITNTTGNGYNVDCNNDGTDEATDITGNSSYTCNYPAAGTYTIRVKDNNGDKKGFRRIRFYVNSTTTTDALKLLGIEQWGTAIWSSMEQAFRGASNMEVNATDVPDLSSVGSMEEMFAYCAKADPDVSAWDTSNITNMSGLFRDATVSKPNVSGWDVSKVSNFSHMFKNTDEAAPDTTNWNTASAKYMNHMFYNTKKANPNVSGWDVSGVTTFYRMFYKALAANPDVSGWNTSSATTISYMFYGATLFNCSLGDWNISSLTSASSVFKDTNLSIGNYDDTLMRWNAQSVQGNVEFTSDAKYCLGEQARDTLIANDNWTITDGGKECLPCGTTPMTLTHMQWKLVSTPCNTGANSIGTLYGSQLGAYDTDWVMYEQSGTDDYQTGSGHKSTDKRKLDANDTLEPGRGYWIIADLGSAGSTKNVLIDNTLSGLSFSTMIDASAKGISDSDFVKVHEATLPRNQLSDITLYNARKYMAGNPFSYAFMLKNLYFSHGGAVGSYHSMGDSANDSYINVTVYKHDSSDASSGGYEAINAATPGFSQGGIKPTEGFFIKLPGNQNDSDVNYFAYPLTFGNDK